MPSAFSLDDEPLAASSGDDTAPAFGGNDDPIEAPPAPAAGPGLLRVLPPLHASSFSAGDEPVAELSPEDQAKVAALKADIAQWQQTAHGAATKAKYLQYAADAVDIPGAIKAFVNLPNRLAHAYGQARGIIPQDVPYQDLQPIVSPEQSESFRKWLSNPSGTSPAEPRWDLSTKPWASKANQIGEGTGQGLDQLASSLTSPENLAAMVVAKRFPVPVGRYFQGEMLGQAPESVRQIFEAPNLREAATAGVGAAANIALPAAIEHGLRPGRVTPSILRWSGNPAEAAEPGARSIAPLSEFGGDDSTVQPFNGSTVQTSEPTAPPAAPRSNAPAAPRTTDPLTAIEAKYLVDDIRHGSPVSADHLQRYTQQVGPMVLPEGYELQGDYYVYKDPAPAPPVETDAQRFARENREAMAAMRASKAQEPPAAEPVPEPNPSDQSETSDPSAIRNPQSAMEEPLGERPPDLLDYLHDNYPGGVRPSVQADYAEHVRAYSAIAQGRDKGFLRLTKGEAADRVLKQMHDEGQFLRIETEDQLLEAMHSAASSRNAWAAQEKSWLDRAIEATRPYSGDPFEGVTGAPVWMTKSLAHGALLAVKGAMALGRSLTQALEHGLKWLREQNADGYHEGEARLWLTKAESTDWLGQLPQPLRIDKAAPPGEAASDAQPAPTKVQRRQPNRDAARRQPAGERPSPEPPPAGPEPAAGQGELPAATPPAAEDLSPVQELDQRIQWHLQQAERAGALIPNSNLSKSFGPFDLSAVAEASGLDEQIAASKGKLKEAWDLFYKLGITPDPLAGFKFYKALYDVGVAYAAKGLRTAEEFAASIGMRPSALLNAAWADAQAGQQKTREQLDPNLFNGNLRQRAETIQASPDISTAVKAGTVADMPYQPRTFESITKEAQAIIVQHGPDAAFEIFKSQISNLPEDTRTALGAELERSFRLQETEARATGDHAKADAMADKQIALWKSDAYGTEIAQGLNARKLYDGASTPAKLRQAQDMFDESGRHTMNGLKDHIDAVAGELRQGQADAVEAIKRDPEANTGARQAVNETIAGSQETHHAVVMELAEPFASAPSILAHAREQVRSKANELLNRGPIPPGLTASQHLRTILDGLAARAATIASAHYQGAEPGVILRDKFMQRLGLSEAAAARLAKAMDTQWEAMVTKAKGKLSQRLATQRARQQAGLTEDATDAAVDRAIRKQLRDLNQRLGQLITQHATTVDTARTTIGDRVVDQSGLAGPAADALRSTLNRRFNALADAAKRRRLEALAKSPAAPLPRKLAGLSDELLQFSRLGGFNDAQFHDLIKKKLGLPVMTDAIQRELVRRANDLEKMPAGFLRDRAGTQLLNWVAQQAGTRWADLPMGMFYGNVLSGLSTAIKIPFENMNVLVGNTLISMLRGRASPLATVQAFARGQRKGLLQSAEVLRSGIVTGVREGEHVSGIMEQQPFGPKGEYINYWKWVGREIAALHTSTFKPAWEVKQSIVAREMAKREGLSGQAAQRRATELLANTPERIEAAKVQARNELSNLQSPISNLDFRRRTLEILEQQREVNMPGSTALARDFALRTTYLNAPYGFLGYIATAVRTGIEGARAQFPILGRGLKSQIPFTTVAANILNEKLNWTPVGLFRAGVAMRSGKLYGRPIMERGEVGDLIAKSAIGTIALGALGTLAGQYIHGSGPASPAQRKQLQAAGWTPNSIGPIAGRYYSYVNTPAAAGLAWIGNWQDWHRYGKGEAADAEARAVYALRGTADVVMQQGMLDGVRRIFEGFGNASKAEGGAAIERSLARTAGSFVAPNLLMQIDKIFDPTVYDQSGIVAALQSQVPFYRREGQPNLNALGEPMQRGPFDSWTTTVTRDPVWRTIAEKKLWISEIPKDIIVGDKKAGHYSFKVLTPDERYRYAREVGHDLRARLSTEIYTLRSLPPDQAQAYLHEIIREVHAAHKPQL